ncbi:MAG: hypothetical protein EU518_00070 [Promethearchaeota archaeon]|nr:MAG: hypothetical protein EU518_00070 [Candidatus Lokiarchaeota archaeon]
MIFMFFKNLKELLENEISPQIFSRKEDFYGIQYGVIKEETQVKKILICLDISIQSIYYAIKNKVSLIISHHPFIQTPLLELKKTLMNKLNLLSKYPISIFVLNNSFISSENGISETIAKSLYLNIDSLFQVEINNNIIPLGRICEPMNFSESNETLTLRSLLERIKRNLNINRGEIPYVGKLSKNIQKICIVGGGTLENKYIEKAAELGCDCFISSNLSHAKAILAEDLGISLINISHHNSEMIALRHLRNFLSLEFPYDEFLLFESKDPFDFF